MNTNESPGLRKQFDGHFFPAQGFEWPSLFLRANARVFAELIGYKFQPGNLPFGDYDEDLGFGVADRNKTRLLVIEARWPRVHEHNRINSGNRQVDGRLRRGLIREVVGERQERQLAEHFK